MGSVARPAAADGGAPTPDSGRWLHGVVRDVAPQRLAEITGLDDRPVRAVRAAGLTAVVSAVPLAQYGEAALRRNLEDLDWLERTARGHHAVVAELFRTGPVVPARLATVYHDEDGIAATLADRRAELAATLDRIAGRAEWGVKGYVAPGAATPPPESGGTAGPGVAYLRRRRAQLTARDEGQRAAARDAAAVHEALGTRAVAARRHPPQDRRLSGAETAMVLNGAYLVEMDRAAEFADEVQALSARRPAIRLQLTGPWPPYSFAGDDAGSEAA